MIRFWKTIRAVAFGVVCLSGAACQTTNAYQGPTDRQFDKVTGMLVMDAQYLAATSDYKKAMAKLIEARAVPNLIPYEDSTISSIQGAYAYEIDDLSASIVHFQNAIAAGGLQDSEVKSLQMNIAQLLIVDGKYAQGAKMMVDWMEVNGETPKILEQSLQAYMKAGDYDAALPLAQKWFEFMKPDEKVPADLLAWIKNEFSQRNSNRGSFKIVD